MTHFDSVPIILEVFWHSSAGRRARHVCVRGSMAALAAMDNCCPALAWVPGDLDPCAALHQLPAPVSINDVRASRV
jgi:hypothetical protein